MDLQIVMFITLRLNVLGFIGLTPVSRACKNISNHVAIIPLGYILCSSRSRRWLFRRRHRLPCYRQQPKCLVVVIFLPTSTHNASQRTNEWLLTRANQNATVALWYLPPNDLHRSQMAHSFVAQRKNANLEGIGMDIKYSANPCSRYVGTLDRAAIEI